MRRWLVWTAIGVLIVLVGGASVALEYFYFELRPILPGQLVNHQYAVNFDWDKGVKTVQIVNEETRSEERDRRWRRLARSTALQYLPEALNKMKLGRVKGKLEIRFDGYGILWFEHLEVTEPNLERFWNAAARCDVTTIGAMLGAEMESNVNATTPLEKFCALRFAAERGCNDVVRTLLAHGADINATDQYGWTPLITAVVEGHAETARVLLAAGANVNVRNEYGGTALIFAAQSKTPAVVEALLGAGADPNAKDEFGTSALMHAAEGGHEGIVRALLAAGADASARDNQGNTALDKAERRGNKGTTRLLKTWKNHRP